MNNLKEFFLEKEFLLKELDKYIEEFIKIQKDEIDKELIKKIYIEKKSIDFKEYYLKYKKNKVFIENRIKKINKKLYVYLKNMIKF